MMNRVMVGLTVKSNGKRGESQIAMDLPSGTYIDLGNVGPDKERFLMSLTHYTELKELIEGSEEVIETKLCSLKTF